MVIGTLTVTLQIPHSQSLKDKRQVVRSLTARLRKTFNVSVSEVAQHDKWQIAELGIVAVSNEAKHADEVCQKVLAFVEQEAEAVVSGSMFELIHA
jgi:uncharacterized protein YlxP (DUF503 family)